MAETWSTSDLRIGAFLRTHDFKIVETRRVGKAVVFEFEDRPDRPQLVLDFFNKNTRVEPLAYMQSISEMRDMVSSITRDNEPMGTHGGRTNGTR